jgi:GNAT superfamily N-acetyltransferase
MAARGVIRQVQADDDLSPFGAGHGPDVDDPRRRRTVVATVEGRLAGVATATWSRRHPDLIAASCQVDPAFRRRGIGRDLVQALERVAGTPLMFRVEESAAGGTPFLAALGYGPLVASTTALVSAADVLLRLRPLPSVPGVTFAAGSLTPDVVDLFEEVYAERHGWAGQYIRSPDVPWITFAGPVIEGTVRVAHAGDRLLGASSLHTGPFAVGADAFLAPTGVLGGEGDPAAARIMQSLMARSLEQAVRAGITTVNVEYDTTYTELATVMDSMPVQASSRVSVWTRPAPGPTSAGRPRPPGRGHRRTAGGRPAPRSG